MRRDPRGTPRPASGRRWHARSTLGVALAVASLVALTGCSGAADGDAAAGGGHEQEASGGEAQADRSTGAVTADRDAAGDAAEAADGSAAPEASAALPVGIGDGTFGGRDVIRTAELELRDDDTRTLVEAIEATVERIGGFVAAAELAPVGEDQVSGHLTLRVPNARLDATLADLGQLADEVGHRRLSTQDVTDQLTDLEAQLTNLRMLEAELRELLTEIRGGDPDAQQVLAVFERLREVRGEIERLEAKRASLEDRVALSTVTVVVDPIAPAVALSEHEPWRPAVVIQDALATTVAALQTIADALIWLVLTALPVAVALAAPVVGAYLLWRRRRTPAVAD